MATDRELDFIKLKVDWYKSVFPWILAMVVGAVTFANSIKLEQHLILRFVFALLLLSIVLRSAKQKRPTEGMEAVQYAPWSIRLAITRRNDPRPAA